jgi:hypothetical protein
MTPRFRRLWLASVLLLVLLAIEFGVSFLPLDRAARPLVLISAVLMVGVVGTVFMEVGRGPEIIRLFAIAALLWLSILLGLGSLDPLTVLSIWYKPPIQDNAEHPLCMLRSRAIARWIRRVGGARRDRVWRPVILERDEAWLNRQGIPN